MADGADKTLTRARFDDMTWLVPDEPMAELAWRLRYGDLSMTDRYYAAEVIASYAAMINHTAETRARVVRELRKAMHR